MLLITQELSDLQRGAAPARKSRLIMGSLYTKILSLNTLYINKSFLRLYIDVLTRYRYDNQMFASVAQLVEQRTENPCVAGSIPAPGTST